MPTIAPTAATPPPPNTSGVLPPPLPEPRSSIFGSGAGGTGSVRHRITGWMEERFGRAAMPIAAVAGGVAGGTVGMLTLGPVGAMVGGAGGALLGAALFLAG